MKSVNEFIVEIKTPFKDEIETAGGLKLYLDRRWSPKQTANIEVTVLEEPLNNPTNIKKGMRIAVEPHVLFRQIYPKSGEAESANKIEDNFYRIHKSQIVLYHDKEWKCYGNNVLAEEIEEKTQYTSAIYIPTGKQISKDKVKLVFVNEDIDVSSGEIVFVNDMGIDFYFQNKKYLWYRNQDILAKYGE